MVRNRRIINRLTDKSVYLVISLVILIFIFYPYAAIFFAAFIKGGTSYLSFLRGHVILLGHSVFVAVLTMVLSLLVTVALAVIQVFFAPNQS